MGHHQMPVILTEAGKEPATLLFAAIDRLHDNTVVLRDILEKEAMKSHEKTGC